MDQALEARALAINSSLQKLQKECSDLAEAADNIAEEIQALINDASSLDEEDEGFGDLDIEAHEAAYNNVVEWQEALEAAALRLDI